MTGDRVSIGLQPLRAFVRGILENPGQGWTWSLQGLGMLRLYLSPNLRLHIWDERYAAPGASPIHDHLQWGLRSTILNGVMKNERYLMHEVGSGKTPAMQGATHHWVTLKAGCGCEFRHKPGSCILTLDHEEWHAVGSSYEQEPHEVHWSKPQGLGCVTLMEKSPTTDGESARVFWPYGEEWGSAEPRIATGAEVDSICRKALEHWK